MNAYTHDPMPLPQRIAANLPAPVIQATRWLLWRSEAGRKVPYYADGERRQGRLDTETDLARLVTFKEATDAYLAGDYTGFGFALTGDGVGAFDLDHCLSASGKMKKDHAGHDLTVEAKRMGAYIEVSPSGEGLRILGKCDETAAYSRDGLEYWGAGRFVTVTGNARQNPKGWADLTDLRSPLGPRTKPVGDRDEDDGPIITRQTLDELREALSAMEADERDLWVRMGHALKTLDDRGKALWLEWSAKSDKFNEADALAKWDSFTPRQTSHKAVFAEAQNNWGWMNPRKRKATADDELASPLSGRRYRPGQSLQPTEYVLDGFLAVGVSVIAGAWGAGKSINIIPLMASVAHLAPDEWGFRPVLRRRIIWITEAPEQAHDTLYSLSKVAGSADWSEFDDWFHIYSSVRKDPTKLADEVRGLADDLAWTNDDGFEVKPVLVFDTTSANIDIENENDNSQVGKAMAALKQSLRGLPVVLIGHTPKALTRADVNDMTFRGAGAWEADAIATYYLVHDRDTDMRFMAICKRRFNPTYTEIDFESGGGSEIVDTPWGDPQAKSYLHGVPSRSNGEARRAARQERMEERREADQERAALQRQERVLAAIRDLVGNGEPPSRENIRAASGMAKNNCNATIDAFIESGVVVPHDLGDDHVERSGWGLRKPFPKIYLPQEVDLDAFTNRTGR